MKTLLHSRKFWLAVFGVAQALILHYVDVPKELWLSIEALVGVLIASIAAEDMGEKMGRQQNQTVIVEGPQEDKAPVQ